MSHVEKREQLLSGILEFLSGNDLLELAAIRASLEREIDEAGPSALISLKQRLTSDTGWSYHPPDPLAARIHYLLADHFIQPESQVSGVEHLTPVGAEPVAIFANHLSYADANVLQVLLHRASSDALTSRLTALAGPKVFSSRERHFSSLCFGTIKVPQSTEVSSEEAVLNPRDVAQAARQAIEVGKQRLIAGDALVLFGEGTRSRSAQMQRMLAGVARYLEVPGTWVLPVGLAGTETLFPVGDVTVRPARVDLRIGAAVRAETLLAIGHRQRQTVTDVIGLMIAALLPLRYRGVYERAEAFPEAQQAMQRARP